MYKKTRWGFAFLALFIGLGIWLLCEVPLQYGIDLRGGTELTYRLDLSLIKDNPSDVAKQVKNIISKRLNAYGLKEISVAIQGDDHMVVQLPGTDEQSVGHIKRQVEAAGKLEFRLVAPDQEQGDARQQELKREEQQYLAALRQWIQSDRTQPPPRKPRYVVRTKVEKEDSENPLSPFVPTDEEITLLNTDEGIVEGSLLSRVGPTVDEGFKPAVHFEFSGDGAQRFGELTGNNIKKSLAITLDDDIMQVATIQDRITTRGQLSGGFSDQDVQGIVNILRGGSLDTKPELISENTVGSVLGQDSIEMSLKAVVWALVGVMAIMAAYYLLGGLVADFAVALNVFFILTYVACFRQTITLPGVAGILLTVGMAVDANILIFERVREEKKKGRSLLQSLATGYKRAFWVIFDANLTTLITGFVLFNVGTGPVKGFAVTLISGILISFITAIFVTRLIVSLLLNWGLVKEFKMLEAFGTPNIGFVARQKAFFTASGVVIALTWLVVLWRGQNNYGIDFTGGARVNMQLREAVPIEDMKTLIDGLAAENPTLFKDYSLQTVREDREGRAKAFALRTHVEEEKREKKVASAQEPVAGGTGAADAPAAPPAEEGPRTPPAAPEEPVTAEADSVTDLTAPESGETTAAQRVRQVLEKALAERGLLLPPFLPRVEWLPAQGAGNETKFYLVLEANFARVEPEVTKDGLKQQMNDAFAQDPLLKAHDDPDSGSSFEGVRIESVDLVEKPGEGFVTRYRFTTSAYTPPGVGTSLEKIPAQQQVVESIRQYFYDRGPGATAAGNKRLFELSEPFSEVATVGPRVATNLQQNAVIALFISMLGIIFYVSLRFEFIFGLAAIVALLHDILISIGVVAVTDHFFGGRFPVKFNLAELAAVLTIIGYSINDTIVVFDRIRENITLYAKKRRPFEEIVDLSINQTLSRTLWTSATTLLVTLVLLFFATEAVRGFAFIFAVGVLTGTYSSVFVASPVLIMLHKRAIARKAALQAAQA